MKVVDLQIAGSKVYYRLNGCSNDEFLKIIEYKSWVHRSWSEGTVRKYFSFIYINRPNEKVIWSTVGFAPILIRYLQSLGWMINGKENFRAKNINIGNMKYKLYKHQQDAINSWMSNGCYGVIKMATGAGKTVTMCEIIRKMGTRTIICMHTSDLLIQWFNTLVEQFGEGIKSQIGIIGGNLSKYDRKKLGIISNNSYEENIKQDIVISTAQSLLRKTERLCDERFGLLIWDEVHRVASEQFNKVASSIRAVYRSGTSATVSRPDGMTPLIWGLLGDICYKITIRELINKKILVDPIFNTIIINDDKIQSDIATCGLSKLDLSRYVKQKSASSIIKVKYILNLVKSLCNNGKCFVMYTDYVNNSSNGAFTRDWYVQELNKIGVRVIGVSSDMGGGERQKVFSLLESKKLDGIIFGSLGSEGVDIPRIDSVIMCNGTRSTIRFTQRVGRGLRVVKNDNSKVNAYIYEIILATPMEMRWSQNNFWEYSQEGYIKEMINIK